MQLECSTVECYKPKKVALWRLLVSIKASAHEQLVPMVMPWFLLTVTGLLRKLRVRPGSVVGP